MLDRLIFLGSFYYSQGPIGDMLSQWESAGFFSYLLPFLLIFSIVFLLVTRLKAFKENKGVSGVIALVVALMAIQMDMVPRFFSEIFPRLGVGVAIILVMLILVGAFADPDKSLFTMIFFGIGGIIFLVIVAQSFTSFEGFSANSFWSGYGSTLVGIIVIIILIAIIVGGGSDKNNSKEPKALIFRS